MGEVTDGELVEETIREASPCTHDTLQQVGVHVRVCTLSHNAEIGHRFPELGTSLFQIAKLLIAIYRTFILVAK